MNNKDTYWKTNLKYLVILLSIWFTVSFGFGILFVDTLNQIQMGGFKLGFWFAQQGAIYVFVILIFIYIYLMNRLDQKFKNQKNWLNKLFLDFFVRKTLVVWQFLAVIFLCNFCGILRGNIICINYILSFWDNLKISKLLFIKV